MGFYIRKALKVGPLRFNLSKSGIGVSAGVKGFRVGTGPRGNYVHMGRGGLYYRKTLPSGARRRTPAQQQPQQPQPSQQPQSTHGPLTQIESGNASGMTDSSSASLLEELNDKKKKIQLTPIVAIAGGIGLFMVAGSVSQGWITGVFFVILLGLIYFAYLKDQLKKSTVLFFDMETDAEQKYEALHSAFDNLSGCGGRWHVEAEGDVDDWKRTAGASSVLNRKSISLAKKAPPYVKTNIAIPSIPVGKRTLYFFPDKILVYAPDGVGAVGYKQLKLSIEPTRFIEDGSVPRDAQVVDRTWQYVNKSGGPDKRFKDNRELPIALYEDLHFTSSTGLNERIQVSKTGLGDTLRAAITKLSQATNIAQPKATTSPAPPKKKPAASKTQHDWVARGKQYYNDGEYKMAIAAFTRVIEAELANGNAYYLRAATYSKMSDKNNAINDLKTAAKHGHQKSQAYLSKRSLL